MKENNNIISNQFPTEEKDIKYKHDFIIKNGWIYFIYFGEEKKFTGFSFITWLKNNDFKEYFEYIVYKWYGSNIIIVSTDKNKKIKVKNTNTNEIKFLDKFPDIYKPKIVGVKPKMNNPIHFLEEEYKKREDIKKEYQENTMKEIRQDLIKNVQLSEEDEINEGKTFKTAVIALMSFFLSMGIQKTYAQCSRQLQAAMQNPNDPKNAKILAGSQVDLDKKISGSNYQIMSPEDQVIYKKQLKDEEAAAKQSAKQEAHDFNDKFNPKLNIQGEKLNKEEKQTFTNNYNSFIIRNPQFKIDPSRYSVEERYAFLTKVIQEQSVIRRLNVLFNRPNPYDNTRMSIDDLYKYIQDPKLNGFDNFTEKYRAGFPGIAFPDNPHKFESKVLGYNDFLNENWFKKAALAGALATSALSGSSQQKMDKFAEFKQSENINKDFKSFDDVNTWIKQNFDGVSKWDITSISIRDNNNLLNISIDRKKSNTGYNKFVLAVNKEGNPSESRDNILSKNPNSKKINSGETNFKGISYDWYLIGINTETTANYTPNIYKSDDNKLSKEIKSDVKKGLIDAQAYDAIYKFETTKGKIVQDINGVFKAVSMETAKMKADNVKYNVHVKDKVIKEHIEKAIGLETWFKIPPKFRMQIFSYMFNSDSYEDKKGDRFRWLAGISQAVNPTEFGTDTTGRMKIMKNKDVSDKAIEYIKSLKTEDFEKAYDNYLKVLHSQYSSLSTENGKAYDKAAKELSWYIRPAELEKYYEK
jgi:hypothetical protein